MYRLWSVLFLVGVLFAPSFSLAQDVSPSEVPTQPVEESISIPEDAVDCFDYYTFNSVQVDVSSSVSTTVPGIPLTLSGIVKNNNPYPVVDGSIFVKIFRKDVDGEIQRNGYPVVAQFYATEDIVVPANDHIPFSFQWDVPHYMPAGDYEAHFFFLVGKKYNLLGLSFTDDVTGNKTAFSVVSDMPEPPAFDKDSVTLNDNPYSFAAYPPRFEKNEIVTADATLMNPSKDSQTVHIVWTLHNWSGEQEGSLLDTKTEVVTLAAGQSQAISYEADPSLSVGAVSVLRAETKYEDTSSFLNIRFVRDGFDEIRLNFPGLLKYPITKGEENTLFSCLHATKEGLIDDSKLTLTLTDEFGTVLDTHVYEGSVSGAMMATKHDFTPDVSSSTFTLSATLMKNGETVEAYETTYDCEDIDPSLCSMNMEPSPIASAKEALSTSVGARILFALFIIVPLGLVIWLLAKRGKSGIASLALLLAFGSFVFAEGVEAKSVVWSENNIGGVCFHHDEDDGQLYYTLEGISANVTYFAVVKNTDTGEALPGNGETVPVGTILHFEPKAREDTDINWFGTGGVWDSPYGYWRSDASIPPDDQICSEGNIGDEYDEGGRRVFRVRYKGDEGAEEVYYSALSVNLVDVSFEHSGTAQLSCSADGSLCTVVSDGSIESSAIFSSTYGSFYHKRSDNRIDGCFGSDTPGYFNPQVATSDSVSDSQKLPIPEQRITFSFEAISASNPPSNPTITGPTTGMSNTPYDFSLVSTDEDGDGIRYGIDWTPTDGVDEANQWLPATDYAESGLAQIIDDREWVISGTYTFKVIAIDETGARSNWVSHTITIAEPDSDLTLCIGGGYELDPYRLPLSSSPVGLSAFYSNSGERGCSEVGTLEDVTAHTTFSGSTGTAIRVDNDVETLSPRAVGTERLTAACISGTQCGGEATDSRNVEVYDIGSCFLDCSDIESSLCKGRTRTISGCDPVQTKVCSGQRDCNTNWKEVVPGE